MTSLEQDPVSLPWCRGYLRTGLTRLVGVWGSPDGLGAGMAGAGVSGLAFLHSKPWLVIGRTMTAAGGPGGAIRMVSVPDGSEVEVCRPADVDPHTRVLACLDLDLDAGDRLLAAMSDGTVRLFDATTGAELRRFDVRAEHVRFLGAGRFVVAETALGVEPSPYSRAHLPTRPARLAVHDLETGALVSGMPLSEARITAIDVAGERIAVALGGSRVQVLDSGLATIWESSLDGGFSTSSGAVAFSPDGKLVAVAPWAGSLKLLDGGTGALVREAGKYNMASPVFSRDGQRFATALHSRRVGIGAVDTGVVTDERPREHGAADCFAWSDDGALMAAGSRNGLVRLYDAATVTLLEPVSSLDAGFAVDDSRVVVALPRTEEIVVADHSGAIKRRLPRKTASEILGIARNGRVVAHLRGGPVVALDEKGAKVLSAEPGGRLAVSRNRLLVMGIDGVTLVDLDTSATAELASGHRATYVSEGETDNHDVLAAVISPDETLAASSSSDGTIAFWSLAGRNVTQHIAVLRDGHVRLRADALAFSRASELLFAVVDGIGANAYEVATQKVRYSILAKEVGAFSFATPAVAADRRLVAWALQDGVLLCDPDDGRVLDRITIGDAPRQLAFAGAHLFVQTARRQLLRFSLDPPG